MGLIVSRWFRRNEQETLHKIIDFFNFNSNHIQWQKDLEMTMLRDWLQGEKKDYGREDNKKSKIT